MTVCESNLGFNFNANFTAIKFDDTPFYRNYFNALPYSKGIDIVALSKDRVILLEIKNCKGHESDNRWRIYPNNAKVQKTAASTETENRDSVDIETSLKTAMTLACLAGANTKKFQAAEDLHQYNEALQSSAVAENRKKILVVLFLEGNFGCESRSKRTVMRELQASIKTKLKWLNCSVLVVDSDTYRPELFNVC